MSGTQQRPARSRRSQQRQAKTRQQGSNGDVSLASGSRGGWESQNSLQTRPITPGRHGDTAAHRPSSAGGKSRRAVERAEDNAGSALQSQRKLDGIIKKLRDNNTDQHPAEVNLESCRIGDRGAVNISHALRGNSSVQRLQLGGCEITYAGMRSLREVLREPPSVNTIRRIELTTRKMPKVGNPLGNHGAECLAEVIKTSVSLRHVNASCCSIGDEGATSLAEALSSSPPLLTLELDQNVIGNSGAYSLGQALGRNTTLQGLSLWKNRVGGRGAQGIAEGMATNSTLQWLGLGCNKLCDDGAKRLARAISLSRGKSKLTWLAIGGNNITDNGAVHVARALQGKGADELEMSEDEDELSTIDDATPTVLPALKSLGIGGNDISDETAEAFGNMLLENDILLSLGMGDCNIGDDGARHIAIGVQGNDRLQRLVLSGNCIGDDGAGYLAGALSQNASLKGLYLAENPITDDGGTRFQEVLCGNYNMTLRTLDVHDTEMSTQGFTELCNTLRKNSNLQQLGTHLSLVDLTASSVSITPSQAAGSDAPDGAVTAPNVAVMKVQAGNALLGQELKTAGGGFRHGVSGGGAIGGGLFRARGSATAAAIQAIPNVSDELTSAEVALEGFRTFVTDDQAAAALQDDADGEKAHVVAGAANRFLNLRLLARRSYIFDKTPTTTPTATETRKKRWSLFGSKRKISGDLSGSQAELVSLSENTSLGDGSRADYTIGNNMSQSSLPPPPADLSFASDTTMERDTSFTDGFPLPPPPLPPRRHSLTPLPATIPEAITEVDSPQLARAVQVREAKVGKVDKQKRQSVTVDATAALRGNWRTPYNRSLKRHGSKAVEEEKYADEHGYDYDVSITSPIAISSLDDAPDDLDMKAWASQAPNDDNNALDRPAVQAKQTQADGRDKELEVEAVDEDLQASEAVKRVKKDSRLPVPKSSPLLARLSEVRGSFKDRRKKKRASEPSENVTVQEVLEASENAVAQKSKSRPKRISMTSKSSTTTNPWLALEYSPSPPEQRRQLNAIPSVSSEEKSPSPLASPHRQYGGRLKSETTEGRLDEDSNFSDDVGDEDSIRSDLPPVAMYEDIGGNSATVQTSPMFPRQPSQHQRLPSPVTSKATKSKRHAPQMASTPIQKIPVQEPARKELHQPLHGNVPNNLRPVAGRAEASMESQTRASHRSSQQKTKPVLPKVSTPANHEMASLPQTMPPADMKALTSKLNAAFAQKLQPPSVKQGTASSHEADDVFEDDDLGPLGDDTDLAIQQISRSASMDLRHPTKARSRPSNRRPPSRETSHSSLQQGLSLPGTEPTSPVSLGGFDSSDEHTRLIPARQMSVPLTPPKERADFLQRLDLLQDGGPLLEDFTAILPALEDIRYRHDIASETQNASKLRPNATLAPDSSLVRLLGVDGKSQWTFVNASYVGNVLDQHLCIATQAPMTETLVDFWRMVWEKNVRNIVAINSESDGYTANYSSATEQDFDLVEAATPSASSGVVYRSALKVISTPNKVHSITNVTCREYIMENSRTMETRAISTYVYNAWAEEDLLGSACDLSLLVEEVVNKKRPREPILVHCKEGGVRTGTATAAILAASTLLKSTRRSSSANLQEGDQSLDQTWLQTARQRPGFGHDQAAYRIYNRIALGVVFGSDSVKHTDVASSRHTSKSSLFNKQKSKKKKGTSRRK